MQDHAAFAYLIDWAAVLFAQRSAAQTALDSKHAHCGCSSPSTWTNISKPKVHEVLRHCQWHAVSISSTADTGSICSSHPAVMSCHTGPTSRLQLAPATSKINPASNYPAFQSTAQTTLQPTVALGWNGARPPDLAAFPPYPGCPPIFASSVPASLGPVGSQSQKQDFRNRDQEAHCAESEDTVFTAATKWEMRKTVAHTYPLRPQSPVQRGHCC